MNDHVELNGVRTWHEVSGDGAPVVLLHGGFSDSGEFDAGLAVVPGTSHVLLEEKPELCRRLVADFLAHDPVPTLVPIRRAPAAP